jgi:hypothetical protein
MNVNKDQSLIPDGIYCYGIRNNQRYICPYWSIRKDKPKQENGYCSFLDNGDWEYECSGLLWDQVKECGINEEISEEDLE